MRNQEVTLEEGDQRCFREGTGPEKFLLAKGESRKKELTTLD
jgi:hypothetical protein